MLVLLLFFFPMLHVQRLNNVYCPVPRRRGTSEHSVTKSLTKSLTEKPREKQTGLSKAGEKLISVEVLEKGRVRTLDFFTYTHIISTISD